MSSESSVKADQVGARNTEHDVSTVDAAAWRATFAAALRVIDHHRANLEARMTIQRLRGDERRPADDAAGSLMRN